MGETGVEYVKSKIGLLRLAILVFGVTTWALLAASNARGVYAWIMAAFIIAWCCTLFSYFFIVTGLSGNMNCGISYEVVDFVITLFSFFHCLAASIVLAINNCSNCDKLIAANVFGFLTVILYFVELYWTQENAPEPTKYLLTKPGIIKLVVLIIGCIAFATLANGYYNCSQVSGCDSGRTFAFAAYIICWCITLVFMLLHLTGLGEKIGAQFKTADFIWAAFSCVFCLVASIVLAIYIDCYNDNGNLDCTWGRSYRIAACLFGFLLTIAYLVEAIMLKQSAPATVKVPT